MRTYGTHMTCRATSTPTLSETSHVLHGTPTGSSSSPSYVLIHVVTLGYGLTLYADRYRLPACLPAATLPVPAIAIPWIAARRAHHPAQQHPHPQRHPHQRLRTYPDTTIIHIAQAPVADNTMHSVRLKQIRVSRNHLPYSDPHELHNDTNVDTCDACWCFADRLKLFRWD